MDYELFSPFFIVMEACVHVTRPGLYIGRISPWLNVAYLSFGYQYQIYVFTLALR